MKSFSIILCIVVALVLSSSLIGGNAEAVVDQLDHVRMAGYQSTVTSTPPPFTPTPLPSLRPSATSTQPSITLTATILPSISPTNPPTTPLSTPTFAPSPTPRLCRAQFFFQEPGAQYVFNNGVLNWLPFELCPSSRPHETVAQYATFSNGFIIFRLDTRTLYVFIDDGTGTVFIFHGLSANAERNDPNSLSQIENTLSEDVHTALGASTGLPTYYSMTFQSSNDPIVNWHGGTVMTNPFGGRLFVTRAAFSDPPPVWAYVNRIN